MPVFEKSEYQERIRVVFWIEVALWGFIWLYLLGGSWLGWRVLPPALMVFLLAGYAALLLFHRWALNRWRFIWPAILSAIVFDTLVLAVFVWAWGGVHAPTMAQLYLNLVLAVLVVGPGIAALVGVVQAIWVSGIAWIDGERLLSEWYLGFLFFSFWIPAMTHILVRVMREREHSLRQHGERLAEDRQMLQESVDRLAEVAQVQVDSLIRAERLAIIGRLAPTIVHDLKNPLGALASVAQSSQEALAEVLQDAPNEAVAEVAGDLEVIRQQLGRLKEMVEGILNLSRQDEGYGEVVDVGAAAQDALTAARLQTKGMRVKLDERLTEGPLPVRGNQGQLSQVMVNLLWNAAQAVGPDEEGIISLTTGRDEASGEVTIEVSDTGPGIPEEVRPRLFEPFFTTKKTGHGTGLGLYLCREIVRRHGGRITVGRHESGGARFVIEIPAAQP